MIFRSLSLQSICMLLLLPVLPTSSFCLCSGHPGCFISCLIISEIQNGKKSEKLLCLQAHNVNHNSIKSSLETHPNVVRNKCAPQLTPHQKDSLMTLLLQCYLLLPRRNVSILKTAALVQIKSLVSCYCQIV